MNNEFQMHFDFYYFELLFCFEELIDSSNDSTGVSNQLWNKVSLFDYIPERICACKKVREGWAVDLALSLPQGVILYL